MDRSITYCEPVRTVRLLCMAAGLFAVMALSSEVGANADVLGAAKCTECHKTSGTVWEGTHHFSTFRDITRSDKAKEIAKNMGFRRIKSGSLCLTCHFTLVEEEGEPKPVSGISCESCHGGGKDYLKIHSEYSGKKKEDESAEEAKVRWETAESAGMIRPRATYEWATNCYGCHIVPDEKLVNDGGHPAGSKFELVAWSQGEIRHNLWYTKTNDLAGDDRKRLLYVVGQAIELEASLRAVARATVKATYAVKMAKRAAAVHKRFHRIAGAIDLPEVGEIAALADSAKLKLNNGDQLLPIADGIQAQTRSIVEKYDGSQMAGVDDLLPAEADYKGKPVL